MILPGQSSGVEVAGNKLAWLWNLVAALPGPSPPTQYLTRAEGTRAQLNSPDISRTQRGQGATQGVPRFTSLPELVDAFFIL